MNKNLKLELWEVLVNLILGVFLTIHIAGHLNSPFNQPGAVISLGILVTVLQTLVWMLATRTPVLLIHRANRLGTLESYTLMVFKAILFLAFTFILGSLTAIYLPSLPAVPSWMRGDTASSILIRFDIGLGLANLIPWITQLINPNFQLLERN